MSPDCVSDDELCALIEGRLPAEDYANLHAHLDGCPACVSLCAAVARSLPRGALPETGQRVGRYVLEERLGAGGMGMVFRARDSTLGRTVALKLIAPHLVSHPAALARFQREARASAAVDHPNLCGVLDVGEDPACPFIALAYLDGETLKDRLARGPMDAAELVPLLLQLCDGLVAAHAAGIIHRDLKPANLMVSPAGQLKVLDFGLARLTDGDSGSLTETGDVLGTVAYMAPEQHRGENVDVRADLWSVGVVAWEALVGRMPFVGPTPVAVAAGILGADPAPLPSTVPAGLRAVIGKCLDKMPSRRYASAVELGAELALLARGLAPRARGKSGIERLLRRRWRALALAAAIVMIAAGAGYSFYRQQHLATERVALAAEVGQTLSEIKTRMRNAALMPAHDVTPEREAVKTKLAALVAAAQKLGGSYPDVEHALGEGALVFDDVDGARLHLEKAYALGGRSPDLETSLGVVLSKLYTLRYNDVRSQPSGPAQDAKLADIKRQLRDPAVAHLTAAAGRADMPAGYVQALIARVELRYDDAARLATEAFARAPLFYEAGEVAADAEARYARNLWATDAVAGRAAFERSVKLFRRVLDVARSDSHPHVGLARALLLFGTREPDPKAQSEYMDAAVSELDAALAIQPGDTAAMILEGRARAQRADIDIYANRPLVPSVMVGIRHCRRALELDPKLEEADEALGNLYSILGEDAEGKGEDPRPWWSQAQQAYEDSLAISPAQDVYSNLAVLLINTGDDEMAHGRDPTAFADQALRQTDGGKALSWQVPPETSYRQAGNAHLLKARWLMEHGHEPGAEIAAAHAELTRALELDPSSLSAMDGLGRVPILTAQADHMFGRDPQAAIADAVAQAAHIAGIDDLSISCYTTELDARIVALQDSKASLPAARAAYRRGLARLPKNAEIMYAAAVTEMLAGDKASLVTAGHFVDELLAVDARSPANQLLRAELAWRRSLQGIHDEPAGLAATAKVLAVNPHSGPAHLLKSHLVGNDPEERRLALAENPTLARSRLR